MVENLIKIRPCAKCGRLFAPVSAQSKRTLCLKCKPDKYRATTEKEWKRYLVLQDMEKRGEICCLKRQVKYPLTIPSSYVADFVYHKVISGRGNVEITEDVKGYRTREYLRKKKQMKIQHGIEIHEV